MTVPTETTPDPVSRILKHCLENHQLAEELLTAVATHRQRDLKLPDGQISLNEKEAAEFVTRFSAEVEPAIWVSKRRKM